MRHLAKTLAVAALLAGALAAARAEEITVNNTDALRSALTQAKPGTTILIAPGDYTGEIHVRDVSGSAHSRIVIRGADPNNPPVFKGGAQALHLADCNYVTLANFVVEDCATNGLNCDDGGSIPTPMHHLIVENVTIQHIGPRGNHDGLKMSGVDQFIIRNCRFLGWGGSGIDMVGCHQGVVEECYFHGEEGFDNSEAIQMKGGCAHNLVQRCFFDRAGGRGLNLGGSTGLPYFRPGVGDYEATQLLVAGNRFYGCQAPIAWPTSSHCRVVQNTIVLPEKWVGRILQETGDPQFKPSHDGVFEKNVVVFDRRVGRPEFINVGPGTAAETWKFTDNAWFDTEGDRKPKLPGTETGSIYQVDPQVVDIGQPTMRITSANQRLKSVGDQAWQNLDAAAWIAGQVSGKGFPTTNSAIHDEVKKPAADLAAPVQVLAGGQPIEVGGYAAPFVGDFDEDGTNDLLVGQFALGRLRIYRNVGSNAQPKFDNFEWFMAGGQPGCVLLCCIVAFTPQLVDFDGDGRTDVLTGSGMAGEAFLFRRLAGGDFAAAEVLENKNGEVLMACIAPNGKVLPRRYNVTALAYDWDQDGDQDLLLGHSPLCLVLNEGTAQAPSFDGGQLIECDGQPILGGLGSPQMADWDGDGLDDLIAGLRRDIVWYRNIGERGKPRFESPRLLVPQRAESPGDDEPVGHPGFHHAFCVVDFNADGRLDLLVGDRFRREVRVRDEDEQQTDEYKQRCAALEEQYGQLRTAPTQHETRVERIERYRQLLRVWQQLEELYMESSATRSSREAQRGFVWYFERV